VVTSRALDEERFEISVSDRAPHMDVTRVPPEDLEETHGRREHRGRGVGLIHLLTRSIRHQKRRGRGNELVLIFDAAHLSRIAEEHLRDVA
jgi:anti-sigma regulatory factor (Ser/Thr protein kinase)